MKKWILALSLPFFATAAQAGTLIEPYLGYEMAKLSATTIAPAANVDATGNATALGVRLGWQSFGLFVAGDYQLVSGGKYKADAGDFDYTRSNLYLTVGYDFPILVRVYGGYGLTNETTFKDTTETKFSGGSAMKVGVDFSFFPLVRVGLEQHVRKFKDAGSADVDALYSKFDDNVTQLVVSLPFVL